MEFGWAAGLWAPEKKTKVSSKEISWSFGGRRASGPRRKNKSQLKGNNMVFVLAGVSGHTQKKDAVAKAALRSLIVVLVLMVIMQLLCSFPHGHQAATLVLLSWSPCMKTPKLLESLTAVEHWALVPSFHNVKGWGFF